MRRMGIELLYRRPRTTKPEPGHKIYPYLLRGMEITRPNQVWAMYITYIPMARGSSISLSCWIGRAASNTRRCTCEPTKPSARPVLRSADISTSTMAADRTKALTTPRQIKPTSTSRQSAWRPNPGRRSTYRRGDSVQTSGTSSVAQACFNINNSIIDELLPTKKMSQPKSRCSC